MTHLANSPNPYVFIVGSPRSGTTMLRRMIDAHPRIAIARETHWIPRYFEKRKGVTADGLVGHSLLDKLTSYHRFAHLKVDRQALEAIFHSNSETTYASFVGAIFDRFAAKKHKPLAGDKTPTYVRKISTLHTLWPQAKFIHLVRDGRDVCLSMMGWRMNHKAAGRFNTWNDDPVVTTALWWKALVELGRQDGKPLGDDTYCEVRYEALVADPAGHCKQIARFLELPYVDSMAHYYNGRTLAADGASANAAWLPPTPGLRDWRSEMDRVDVERFEAAAGDLLTELGLERAFRRIGAGAREHVRRIATAFTQCAHERNWRLPNDWDRED